MADSVAKRKARQTDLSRTHLAVDSVPSSAAGPDIFATVASILVKQILNLREALGFYQMHFFGAQPDLEAYELDVAWIHKEATEAAHAHFQEQMALNERKVSSANAKVLELEDKLATVAEQHAKAIAEQLNAQREVLEKANEDKLKDERAKAFEENQKLSNKVHDLQARLRKRQMKRLGKVLRSTYFE